jgi:aryl-alcohol dehydrogenase-like predicted oxidoreductase
MQYTTLGRTGLKVSVAGLGGGGGSQLGLDRGKSKAEAADIVRLARDLGVTLFDTAQSYMTEEVIGDALADTPRDSVVLCTKHQLSPHRESGFYTPEQIVEGLDRSLKRLCTDYVDVYYLHALTVPRFKQAMEIIVPALLREKEKGKFRFLGVTEAPTVELDHAGAQMALPTDVFDATMIGFQLLHQNARELVFPITRKMNIGTVLMFVVRNIFADPEHLRVTFRRLGQEGKVPAAIAEKDNPLDFLLHGAGAKSLVEAAYRFARHEPGVDVVLFGTGNPSHLRENIAAITAPPLPPADVELAKKLLGGLVGEGLDIPGRVPPSVRPAKG